jgi:single-strand DNA-binding protein
VNDFNRVILIGNLTREPELRQFAWGAKCSFTLAVNHRSNRTQEEKEFYGEHQKDGEVVFMAVEAMGGLADSCVRNLQRGSVTCVEGYLKFEQWKDKQGISKARHVVHANRIEFLLGVPKQESAKKEPTAPTLYGVEPEKKTIIVATRKIDVGGWVDDLPF